MGNSSIECLYSHACKDTAVHELGSRIQNALINFNIVVRVDNLQIGDHIRRWAESTEFESVIFVASQSSWKAKWCKLELEIASKRSAPIFLVHLGGPIPERYREHIRLEPEALTQARFPAEMARLAAALRERVDFVRGIQRLRNVREPIRSAAAARDLAVVTRSAILAEHVKLLAGEFRESQNEQFRYWLARAIGRAGTAEAKKALAGLQEFPTAGFGQLGIEEAIKELPESLS